MSIKDPRETVIGWLIGKTYDVISSITPLADKIEITEFERHTTGTAVAYVCGAIPGIIAGKLGAPVWVVPPLSFASSWWVCENIFPEAHEYYGHGSIWHRLYDLNSISAGLLMYYLVKK